MPACDYCGASFDDESAYLEHLRDAHADELGPIDSRRLDDGEDDGDGTPVVAIALGVLVIAAVALAGFAFLSDGPGGDPSPSGPGPVERSAHGHGTLAVTVLGDRVDFAQPRYQLQADEFHFENGNGRIWHVHAEGVTLRWAMVTLGIEVTADSVTYDGETYRDGDTYAVSVTVNGDPVDPSEYVLEGVPIETVRAGDGPHVEITVRRR